MEELLFGVFIGASVTVIAVILREELWVFAIGTKNTLVGALPFLKRFVDGVRSRWRLLTLKKRDLEWQLNGSYLHLDERYDELDDRSDREAVMFTMDNISSVMARSGCEPHEKTKRRMVENGHHDRFYWDRRDIEWPDGEEE